jgi:hypothetical protein
MRNRLLRPFLIVEFLIAVQAVFTFWSQVGGQYHLDLMFWPWKFGLSIAAASLIVAVTANLVKNDGAITRLTLTLCSFLIVVIVVAGMVTYYYHLSEPPPEQDDQSEDEPAKASLMQNMVTRPGRRFLHEPWAGLPYRRTPSETPAYWRQSR